jgi:hypothetical protein
MVNQESSPVNDEWEVCAAWNRFTGVAMGVSARKEG